MRCPIESREQERLLAYCARKLDRVSAEPIEEHIRACANCGEFVKAQRAVWEALDSWEAAPVSADFDRRLYRRIEQEVSWWDLLMRPFRPLMVRQGLPIAAAACLLIVAGYIVQRPPETAPAAQQHVEASADSVEHAIDDMEFLQQLNHIVRTDSSPRM